jgi:hypothetical protein
MRGLPVKNASPVRLAAVLCLLGLAACGGGGGSKSTSVGVGIGVSLSAPSATTLVAEGATAEIDATVSNDPAAKGVTWTLSGAGSLQSSDTGKAIYLAPTGVSGAVFATLTARSISDTTKASSVTLTVNGTPVIQPPVVFPANQNVVYATYANVAGGTAPYKWEISTGTLPAGLALNGSTAAQTVISGTPTALGSTSITLKVSDSATPVRTATVDITIVVNAQTACLLGGRYAYLVTGFKGKPVVRAGSFNVAGDGTVTGIEDYKDASGGRAGSAITSGVCKTITQNRGTIQLTTAVGSEKFDYAVVSSLKAGHLQENDGTGIVGGGQFFQQDATAFAPATYAGDYVFGLVGIGDSDARLTMAGRFTLGVNGTLSGGVADNNAATPVAAGALTGTLGAVDPAGRGSGTLTLGGTSLPVAYYVIDANRAFVVSADTGSSAVRVAGQMTRQTGAGTLDATALASPSILSLWGSSLLNGVAVSTVSAGRLSGAVPAAGTVDVLLDVTKPSTVLTNAAFAASPYTVAASGRGTLTLGTGAAQRHLVLYTDGNGGGFVIEPASTVGSFGELDKQVGAPFSTFPTAYYVGGTLFPGSTSPITLAPQILFQNGSLGGNLTGSYAIDPTNGRMVASVTRNILGGTGLVMYVVSTQKLVILGDNVNSLNSQLAWFQHF